MNVNDMLNDRSSAEIPASVSDEAGKNFKKSRFSFLTSRINRRNIVIFASIVLIGGAVYLNWLFFSGGANASDSGTKVIDYTGGESGETAYVAASEDGAAAEGSDYFATAQLNRQLARDEAMEALQLVVDSENSLAEAKDNAVAAMSRIASNIAAEANVEALVCAKGFEKCVAVINDKSANIVVKSDGLLPNEVIQIKEIVCDQSGLSPSAIKIIEVN